MNISISSLRLFITDSFSDEELATLCFDHIPQVYENFAADMTKSRKIQLLLEHYIRHDMLPQLLSLLEKERPQQYAKWISQAGAKRDLLLSGSDSLVPASLTDNTDNTSGGINLNNDTTNIAGDVVGRDKIESAGGHIIHAGSGATVIINAQSPDNLTLVERIQQARLLLDSHLYDEAARLLTDTIRDDPNEPQVRVLYALALLRGRNPEAVSRREIALIEAHLIEAYQAVVRLQPNTRFVASVALAVVKHDFYIANGMDEGTPSLEQLVDDIRAQPIVLSQQTLLQHVRATRRAKKMLNIDW